MTPQLTLVIPVYNEADNIRGVFDAIRDRIGGLSLRVLVVYDFDGDTTVPVVERIMGEYPFEAVLVKNTFGRGAVNAIKTGFASAVSEAVLVVMADLSDDLSAANRMYEMIRGGCDVVCGSRYMKGGGQVGGPVVKKTISRIAGLSLRFLTGIPTHDVTNSFKMYRRQLLERLQLESDGGFEIGMEITVKAFVSGSRVCEVPTVWRDREGGVSRFRLFRWMPKYLKWYFYALRRRFIR
ncbi:MAG: glycosyltransferase [Nitrospiraceae bacterium]|nr:glycosyltransferase [Nitrospiraceae bacterium]